MIGKTVRRLLTAIPTLIGVSIVVFLMMRWLPGDPALQAAGPEATGEQVERIRRDMGLDQPLITQYVNWVKDAFQGDFGNSTVSRAPALEEVLGRFPATLELTMVSIVIATIIGIVAGVISAVNHNKLIDRLSMVGALIGVCTPSFWLAMMLMLLFGVKLGWLPPLGSGSWKHLILPSITLGTGAAAIVARVTRSSTLDVMGQDYVRTARAKGLSEAAVIGRHVLKSALVPVSTVVGLEFGGLLAGSVVTETVFAYPGVGNLLVTSIQNRDFPIVQVAMLLFSLQFVLINVLVDLVYSIIDPRVQV